ncbi:MAG: AAA family ATPase [Elusimicrobia bacterium]|nr:AAA family ATPase [Elusimicrobiota bacterium]
MLSRYLEKPILDDLAEKMVFLGGPRQVGKTTLVKTLGQGRFKGNVKYLNWDAREDKKRILAGTFAADEALIIFDEIHKYRHWKTFIKGFFDKNRGQYRIIVTGSSRLDVYRKGGDSLLGRYHHYRLHPLSLHEVVSKSVPHAHVGRALGFQDSTRETRDTLDRLLKFGGFPESCDSSGTSKGERSISC